MNACGRHNRRFFVLLLCSVVVGVDIAALGPASAVASLPLDDPVPGSAAAQAAMRFPEFKGMPDSRGKDAAVVMHGKMTELTGEPLRGAQVLLSAWPSAENRRKLETGSTFSIAPVAMSATDQNGVFELRTDFTPDLEARHGRDGMDVELNVFSVDRHFVHLTQVNFDKAARGWQKNRDQLPGEEVPSRAANSKNRFDIRFDKAHGSPVPVAGRSGKSKTRDHVAFPYCSNYTSLPSTIGRTTVASGAAANGVAVKATYAATAVTESSTGFSRNGGVSFSSSGSRSRTATWGANFASVTSSTTGSGTNKTYRLDWQHTVQKRHCAINAQNDYEEQIITSPDKAIGGASAPASTAWTCPSSWTATVSGVDSVFTESQRAKTYTNAFAISAGAGSFSGSTTTNYGSSMRIEWTFPTSAGGKWCGDTGWPADPGQRIKAQK